MLIQIMKIICSIFTPILLHPRLRKLEYFISFFLKIFKFNNFSTYCSLIAISQQYSKLNTRYREIAQL
jgi:hypothetical protein